MKKFNVFISENALNELSGVSPKIAENIKSSLKELETNPFRARPNADIKKLKGLRNPLLYRLRVGDYRILYAVIQNDVKITHILKRSKAYESLD